MYSRVPLEIRIVPVTRRFLGVADCARSAAPASAALQSRQPVCRRRLAVPSRLRPPAAGPQVEVAAAAAACAPSRPRSRHSAPVHARQAPPSGRQRTPRSFSVAANNSCRLRCRCSASAGLRTHEWLQACGYFKGRVADQLDESEQRGVVR